MKRMKVFSQQMWMIPEVRGISSLSFLRYFTKAVALGRLLVVTRWFSPAQMGVYGAALLILAIAEVTTETGVNVVLLKHPEKLKNYIHTAWLVSMLRGGLIAVAMLLLAQPLQAFFETPTLPNLLVFCALAAAIRGLINPAIISFQQSLEFGKETLFRTPLQLLDLFSGLFFAWWWQSVSGLLMGLIIAGIAEVGMSFWIFKLRPNLRFARWGQLVDLYRETRTIVVNGVIQYFTEHSDDILIGRLLGPAALGVYQTAYKLVSAVTIDFAAIMGQALYPIYAARVNQAGSIRKTFFRSSGVFFLVMLPIVAVVLARPTQLTSLLLGPEWAEVGRVLPWLLLGALAKSGLSLVTPLVILKEQVRYLLGINLFIISTMLAGIYLLSIRLGVEGAAVAVFLSMVASVPFTLFMTRNALRQR